MKNLKQFRKIIILTSVTVFLMSCSSAAKFSTAKTIDITPTIVQKPTVADMQVNEKKVTGTHSSKVITTTLESIQNEAVASALKTVNADVLVEPRFETTVNGSLTTVTVTGFPATFKNFRPMKDEDIPLMKIGAVKQINTFTPPTLTEKKPGTGKTLLIILGTLGLTAAVLSGVGLYE